MLRITEVESFILHVPIPRPISDALNAVDTWGLPGCRITTDSGLVGTGFTSTHASGDLAIKSVIDEIYRPMLIGMDAQHHQRIWRELFWGPGHWVGRAGISQMALAAVDIAIWDLKAKSAGLPLWQLIGGDKAGRVRSYNTDGGWLNFSISRLVDEMKGLLDQGWQAVKMKVGLPDPREDVRRVQAVRSALGDSIDLMIDVNQGWDRTTACTWAPRFEEFDVTWLEEPLDPDDVEGHRRLADVTKIPIALGEHVYSRAAFRDYIESGCIGYVQADVTRLGGVTEWLGVAELALAHHIPVVPHHADMMRVHQHLGVGHPAVPMIECIPWLQDVFTQPISIEQGWFIAPEVPGASTDFDPEAYARYRVA